MSKTKTRFGFKSKSQLPLFMIWREWLDNDGEVYDGKVLFTTSHINGKAIVLSTLATIAFIASMTIFCLGLAMGIGWLILNLWVFPIIGAAFASIAAIACLLAGAWLIFSVFYEMFSK